MSILWTKKVERLCCFFKFLILLLLWCQITNRAMDPLTIIPAFYVFKDCSVGFLWILVSMKIYFFLFQYRMKGFNAGIIVWISLTAIQIFVGRMQIDGIKTNENSSLLSWNLQGGIIVYENASRKYWYDHVRPLWNELQGIAITKNHVQGAWIAIKASRNIAVNAR